MRRFLLALFLLLAPAASAQQVFQVGAPQISGLSPLPSADIWVGNGSGIATAVAPSGDLTVSNTGAFTIGANKVTLPDIAQIATNTVLGNATSGTANVTALAVGSCSAAADALIWTTNTGFGCNTAVDAATLLTKTWASPAAIGTGTPAAGTFTTVTANTSVATPLLATASGSLTISPQGGSSIISTAGTFTQSSAGDNSLQAAATNAASSAFLKLTGRQSSVDSTYSIVSSGSGLGGGTLRIVLGNFTGTVLGEVRPDGTWNLGGAQGAESLRVVPVASPDAWLTATGSNGGNAVLGTSSRGLTIGSGGGVTTAFTDSAPTLANIVTGTNADVLCVDAGKVIRLQAAASCTISSQRFKTDIRRAWAGLWDLLWLRPSFFKRIGQESNPDNNAVRTQLGLIAEDVASIEPAATLYEQDGVTPKAYHDEAIIAMLVNGAQQQLVVDGVMIFGFGFVIVVAFRRRAAAS